MKTRHDKHSVRLRSIRLAKAKRRVANKVARAARKVNSNRKPTGQKK